MCLVLSLAFEDPGNISSSVLYREVFLDFDPAFVSKLSERKIIAPGSPSSSLLSEQKLRGVIENARQILKVSQPLYSLYYGTVISAWIVESKTASGLEQVKFDMAVFKSTKIFVTPYQNKTFHTYILDSASCTTFTERNLHMTFAPRYSEIMCFLITMFLPLQVIDEFGSFDKYCWSFVNHRPILSTFRYPRQVPVKTSKADAISKDLVRRGFRSVGPTVVYTFMQVSGMTNDHLVSCYRFAECATGSAGAKLTESAAEADSGVSNHATEQKTNGANGLAGNIELSRTMDELSIS